MPLFLHSLDGNSSDKVTLDSAVEALHEQLQAPESEPSFFVADSGIYSEANMRRFTEAKIRWISRVPETSTEAKAVVETAADRTQWQDSEDGQTHWFTQTMSLPQGPERLSSLYAQSREKHGPRPPSSGRWRKPGTVGSESSGICPSSTLPGVGRCAECVDTCSERAARLVRGAKRVAEF